MPVTNIGTKWSSGKLIFFDKATGSSIMEVDGPNLALDIVSGGALKIAGTAITATAAEVNKLAGVTGGTVAASKAVVTGANGALDFDGAQLDNVANANVIGGIPVIHRIDITAGALGNTDVVLTHKTRVINAWLVLRGAGVATTTLQVFNGANAITDAMAASGSDQAVVRCASLNDAYWEIAAAGTLRVTSATGATQPDATVYVEGIRVA